MSLAICLCTVAVSPGAAGAQASWPPDAADVARREARAAREEAATGAQDGTAGDGPGPRAGDEESFLDFLEYLGSWEESDEEWQQFHPTDGLMGAREAPPTATRPDAGTREMEKDDDDERS